jgi:hypothetical protein
MDHVLYLGLLLSSSPAQELPPDQSPLISPLAANQPQASAKDLENASTAGRMVPVLKQACTDLVNGWRAFELALAKDATRINVAQLHVLCRWTLVVKATLFDLVRSGLWIGSAWSSFIQHVTEELVAFILRLSGKLNREAELAWLTDMVADHISIGGHLIDPSGPPHQRRLVRDQLALAEQGFQGLEAIESAQRQQQVATLSQSNSYASAFNGTPQYPSIGTMPPQSLIASPPSSSSSLESLEQLAAHYIPQAAREFAQAAPHLLSQQIPNVAQPVDVLHIEREHNFALRQIQRSGAAVSTFVAANSLQSTQ